MRYTRYAGARNHCLTGLNCNDSSSVAGCKTSTHSVPVLYYVKIYRYNTCVYLSKHTKTQDIYKETDNKNSFCMFPNVFRPSRLYLPQGKCISSVAYAPVR